MARLTTYFGIAATLLATACIGEVDPEADENAAGVEPNEPSSMPGQGTDSGPPCGAELVLDADGKPIQVPVLCDLHGERLPDLGEEELVDEWLPHQEVETPYGQPGS
jgi:hypothetical protein